MIVNVENFKRLIQKATVNYSISSLQLNLDKNYIKSNMVSVASDVISILKVKNDVLPEVKGELQLNFNDPSIDLIPFLNLVDTGADTVMEVSEEKISILTGKQVSKINFCSPAVVSVFSHNEPKDNFPVFNKININEEFNKIFDKIKKIGSRFEKVYFGVNSGVFYIETTDKTNKFANSFKVDLGKVKYNDVTLCFDYKNIVNLMSIIGSDEFTMDFFYMKDHGLGMLKAGNENNSESYYLMSKKEQ